MPVFMVMKEHVTQCSSVTYGCVSNRFWTTMESVAQRNKLYQALDTKARLVAGDCLLFL